MTDFGNFEDLFGNGTDTFAKAEEELAENKCRKSIIDFEFLLDASGSIQESNWNSTVEAIGKYWIRSPLLADNCGNRVAGRRFSNE